VRGHHADDPLVSRIHVILRANPEKSVISVRDTGSLNGTCVGEERISPEVDVAVAPGQEIRVGRSTIVVG
jgi:pSer/pThr/pTyr-binding forkhead associated (FHA) protein